MHNFTLHLTNGIFLPSYTLDKDAEDRWLLDLSYYLQEFSSVTNVREKIKNDFSLDTIFDENRQSKAVKKVKETHNAIM